MEYQCSVWQAVPHTNNDQYKSLSEYIHIPIILHIPIVSGICVVYEKENRFQPQNKPFMNQAAFVFTDLKSFSIIDRLAAFLLWQGDDDL